MVGGAKGSAVPPAVPLASTQRSCFLKVSSLVRVLSVGKTQLTPDTQSHQRMLPLNGNFKKWLF